MSLSSSLAFKRRISVGFMNVVMNDMNDDNHLNSRNVTPDSFNSFKPTSSGYSICATTSRMPALMIIFAQFTQGVKVVYIVEPFVLMPCTAACTIAFSSEWQQTHGSE